MLSDDYSDIRPTSDPQQQSTLPSAYRPENTLTPQDRSDQKPGIGGVTDINSMLTYAGDLFSRITSNKVNIMELDKECRDFRMTYPIVYKLMKENKEYNRKAFKLYLENIAQRNTKTGAYWKDAHDFAKSQSLYMITLYKARKPTPTKRQIYDYTRQIQETIDSEWKVIKKKMDEIQEMTEESIQANHIKTDLLRLAAMPDKELKRLRDVNWSASLGISEPDCV
jgi:hypothetical protein